MKIYNTLSRSIEPFEPLNPSRVTMYCCGPTVYDVTHIGHMRKYVMDDVLKRTLEYFGYPVTHVMNITDVGHLTNDDDDGEDKLEKGARKHGQSVWDVVRTYTGFFHETMKRVNVSAPDTEPAATDHIPAMIFLIKQLEDRGVTYETPEAVYFDTSAFPGYGALSGQKLEDKKQAVREDVHADPDKRHPQDFALWFKRVGRFANHTMHWESPWGDGFPGWHIECSAMSMHYLGQELDIHTGGIDHIPVHHENEIAQSEAATGKQFVRYWVHHNFLQVDGQKMSKSLGNVYTYKDLEERGIHPLALRLLFLQTHYRQEMNFTWESARAAQEAFTRLSNIVLDLKEQTAVTEPEDESRLDTMRTRFRAALSEDLQTPQAVAILWEVARSSLSPQNKLFLLMEFDSALGLGFSTLRRVAIPEEIQQLARQRDMARAAKDWSSSDSIRGEIESRGYAVEDTSEGTRIVPK